MYLPIIPLKENNDGSVLRFKLSYINPIPDKGLRRSFECLAKKTDVNGNSKSIPCRAMLRTINGVKYYVPTLLF